MALIVRKSLAKCISITQNCYFYGQYLQTFILLFSLIRTGRIELGQTWSARPPHCTWGSGLCSVLPPLTPEPCTPSVCSESITPGGRPPFCFLLWSLTGINHAFDSCHGLNFKEERHYLRGNSTRFMSEQLRNRF